MPPQWTGASSAAPARQIGANPERAGHPEAAVLPPLSGAELDDALVAWRQLYATRPWLDEEATAKLKAERAAAAEAIAAGIGNAPPGSLGAVLDRWRGAEAREQLLLIDGVGRNPSSEAVSALESMYATCSSRRVCEDVLSALGNNEGDGNVDLLVQVLNGEDSRAAQVAAMALYGEAAAETALIEAIYGAQTIEVRLEAVHSLAGVASESAVTALSAASTSEALEPRVQVYAAKEVERLGG